VRPDSTWVEYGNPYPDDDQRRRGVETLVESLDCVGQQLAHLNDPKTALLAATLLEHLRRQYRFPDGSRWRPSSATSLESEVAARFNEGYGPEDPEWSDPAVSVDTCLTTMPRIAKFLGR